MTDRIRELMNQVGIGRPVGAGDGDTYVVQPVTPAQLRKFASLVRREALEEAAQLAIQHADEFDREGKVGPAISVRSTALRIRALAAQEADK